MKKVIHINLLPIFIVAAAGMIGGIEAAGWTLLVLIVINVIF